jgi:hypothetical protein
MEKTSQIPSSISLIAARPRPGVASPLQIERGIAMHRQTTARSGVPHPDILLIAI